MTLLLTLMTMVLSRPLLAAETATPKPSGKVSKCELNEQSIDTLRGLWECTWSPMLDACLDQKKALAEKHAPKEPGSLAKKALHVAHGAHLAKDGAHVVHGVSHSSQVKYLAKVRGSHLKALTSLATLRMATTALAIELVPAMVAFHAAEEVGNYWYTKFSKAECLKTAPYTAQDGWKNCQAVYDDPERIDQFLSLPEGVRQSILADKGDREAQFTCTYYRNLLELLRARPRLSNLQCNPEGFSLEAVFEDDTVIQHKVKYGVDKKTVVRVENTWEKAGKIFARQMSRVTNISDGKIEGFGKDVISAGTPSTTFTANFLKRYIPDARECCQAKDDQAADQCRRELIAKPGELPKAGATPGAR